MLGPGQVPWQMHGTPLLVILAEQAGPRPLQAWVQLPSSPPPFCSRPVASLTRAGAARVGPRLRQQVEKHVAQEAPQGKAEQLLQALGPSF